MNGKPHLADIDMACRFVADWFGWAEPLEGPPIRLPFDVPDAIRALNHRLGRLWLDAPPVDLFGAQDRLIPPPDYAAEPGGVIPILWENQSVWGCGFTPATGAQLWVTGDWPDDRPGQRGWRPTPHPVEVAIIFALLGNTVWASADITMDEEDEGPTHADRLLWDFAPFDGFHGFWTDRDMRLIRMQGTGWGVTART